MATDATIILTVLNFGSSDQNIALTIRKIVPKIVNNTTIFLSIYILTGGDCEMLVFDKAEGISCSIENTSTEGDYVFLHISSDKYTTKTPE